MTLTEAADKAHYVTYPAAAGAVTVWGLHINEVAAIVASVAALSGAVIQVLSYLDRRAAVRRGVTVAETYQHGKTD